MIAVANECSECALVNPIDALQQEGFVHPSEPPTGDQTQVFTEEGEVRDFLVRAIVIGDEDVPARYLELMPQRVPGQEQVGGRSIQGKARA